MRVEDRLDASGIHHRCTILGGEPIRDPGRLGAPLEPLDVLLPPPAIHRDDGDEAPAGDESDEQQPPLEFRHVAGRIGPRVALGPKYTRPR